MEAFKGKVAVVTGAGGTICSVVAVDMAKKGSKVVLIGRTEEKLRKTADRISEVGGICSIKACDVCSEADMSRIADEVEAEFGLCSILVNGAGGNNLRARTTKSCFDMEDISNEKTSGLTGFWDIDMNAVKSVIDINVLGTVIAMRVFCKQMVKNGGGSVVNFCSMNSYCPLTGNMSYAMSKAAVDNYTKWSAAYFAPANIRVNAVAPGFIITPMSANYLGTVEGGLSPRGNKVIAHTPQGRFGKGADMVGTIEFLCDDAAAGFVTGATIPVDGGFLTLSGV